MRPRRPADADPRGRHPGPLPSPLPRLNAGERPAAYWPSPNLSLTSAVIASAACCSSSPSGSSSTSAPRPAASIMMPMMLLALTRRPLRDMNTSHLKLLASFVSLAEARACKPSLLLMTREVRIIRDRGLDLVLRARLRHLHDPLRGAGHRAGDQRVERFAQV